MHFVIAEFGVQGQKSPQPSRGVVQILFAG